MKVGFIGMGKIGLPMALRIAGAGHDVAGHARKPADKQALVQAGGRLSTSLAEVARHAEVLCLNLFDDAQLESVLLGEGRVLSMLSPGSVVAIHTTGSPALARRLASEAPRNVDILDATFSGTDADTARGALNLMVGGRAEALEKARPVLSTYADKIAHLGPVGAGQTLKLINNALFAANVKLAAEALRLAGESGLDVKRTAATLKTCSGGSYGLGVLDRGETVAEVMSGLAHYLDKDMDAARAAAKDAGLDLGLLDTVTRDFGKHRKA